MMNDIEDSIQSTQDYAITTESTYFDKVLPERPNSLHAHSNKFPYLTKALTIKNISLIDTNEYHEYIFKACISSWQSEWFDSLTEITKTAYFDIVRKFFDWIIEFNHNTLKQTKYTVLNTYEAYLLNEKGSKNSCLEILIKIIREGLACSSLSEEGCIYLDRLTAKTKKTRKIEPKPVTLSNWFNLPWLREVLGEQTYLQLESPRILSISFRVTIATTLLWLQEQRQRWSKAPVICFDATSDLWHQNWNPLIIESIGNFTDKGEPKDDFNQLLLNDLVSKASIPPLKIRIANSGIRNLPKSISVNGNRFKPWKTPLFFHPKYQTEQSPIEEQLCAWLIACEAVQPKDIPKLKTNNYAREYNDSGRLLAMECNYYKGRSGRMMMPAILMGTDPWTKALDSYITNLPKQSPLFKTTISQQDTFPDLKVKYTNIRFIYTIWKLSSFQKQLKVELKRSNATPIFSNAMFALEEGGEVYTKYNERTGKTKAEYKNSILRALPISLFSLTHIKTSAIHAKSDIYRMSDLINHNSHSSLTEKTSYLTDANKEWMNQSGRITRLVINDLQETVYQPSITAIQQAVNNRNLHTKVIQHTHTDDIKIYSPNDNSFEENENNEFIITDTVETALTFIHYIEQAKEFFPRLMAVRPDWVENTLIIKIEWITNTLNRMSSATIAENKYPELACHLPLLFSHLLETTE